MLVGPGFAPHPAALLKQSSPGAGWYFRLWFLVCAGLSAAAETALTTGCGSPGDVVTGRLLALGSWLLALGSRLSALGSQGLQEISCMSFHSGHTRKFLHSRLSSPLQRRSQRVPMPYPPPPISHSTGLRNIQNHGHTRPPQLPNPIRVIPPNHINHPSHIHQHLQSNTINSQQKSFSFSKEPPEPERSRSQGQSRAAGPKGPFTEPSTGLRSHRSGKGNLP